MKLRYYIALWVVFFSMLTGPAKLYAQYGLAFAAHEVVLDQRTGMDLSEERPLCSRNKVGLSFDFSFLQNQIDYFGYIARVIINDETNIDLLYDPQENIEHHFRIVIKDRFSNIAFNIDSADLFHDWTRIGIEVDAAAGELRVSCGDSIYTDRIELPQRNCLKILFGANNYREFKTTDVPAMKIQDVRILEDGKLIHHWPLDEETGSRITDRIRGATAVVTNPHWIKHQHYEWELLDEVRIGGQASTAFDPRTERVFVVGRDSLLQLRIPDGERQSYTYTSGPLLLVDGSQSFFDTTRQQLLNFSIDQQVVSTFSPQSSAWSTNFDYPGEETNYLHFNKFLSPTDSSLYFMGGYGHFQFKNEVHQYTPDGEWHTITPAGDPLVPRYLAALGATEKGAYLLGGYGSPSGQQMLSPRNLYDLLFFDVSSHTFSKKYELNSDDADFVWANSLVIDEASDRFYGLTFPKQQYNATLQLVGGSLSHPVLEKLGGPIPYLFHDIRSFADLYYCANSKRFIAVTLYHDEQDVTTVKIYSLFGPPLPQSALNPQVQKGWFEKGIPYGYLGIALVGLLLSAGAFLLFRKKKSLPPAESNPQVPETLAEPPAQQVPVVEIEVEEEPQRTENCIFLFGGDLQLFGPDGTDMTRSFTPLIKELFLVILLHTLRRGRGISSEKLTEQFWFDKSTESARNNRSVNIAKINTILERLGNAKISKETGYWKLRADDDIYIDYKKYLAIVIDKDVPSKNRIQELSAIVQRGGFLSETDYAWLDPFKEEVSIQVINTYMRFAENAQIADDPEFMIELANNIFYFDPVHEEAMTIKCKALAHLGNHSLATQTFESFRNEYRQIYGEEFGKDYKTIML